MRARIVLSILFLLALTAKSALALETANLAERLTATAVVVQNYDTGYYFESGSLGTDYGPFVNLTFKQKLFDRFYAQAALRLQKSSSNENTANPVQVQEAQFTYLGSFFNYTVGRRDIRPFLAPLSYYGPFLSLGEAYLDAVSFTIPFRVYGDIPDSEAFFQAPYNALSVLYIPNLFSLAKSQFDGSQGLIIGQLHIKFSAFDTLSDLILNYGRGTGTWFNNSSLSDQGGFDASYRFNFPKEVSTYVDYSSLSLGAASSVVVFGQQIDKLQGWTFGTTEYLTFEYQMPLSTDPADPFTGGNPQNPALAQVPLASWFVSISNHLGNRTPTEPARFHYGAALTNNPGDYSFVRLAEGSLSQPVAPGFGAGPRAWSLPFVARDYETIAVVGFVGYEF